MIARRRRRPGGRLLVVLPILAGVALVGAGCSPAHSAARAPSTADIQALLARHARALLDHSRSAFLADVDTARSSTAFRTRQADQLDNISDVPLAGWSYAIAAPVTDVSAQQAATKRYGAPATIVHLTLSYELAGVDLTPDRHDLWWTFVRRDGHVRLAGDDDLAGAGGTSWRGLWDFGPVVAARATATVVLGHIATALQVTRLADVAAAAIAPVTAVWGADWSRRAAVLVPADAAEFTAVVGSANSSPDVSAVAVTTGIDPQSHRAFGQRVVLDPAGLDSLSGPGEQIVVRHELTHLATAAATSDTTPRWLVEGFADYVGQRGDGQSVAVDAAELRRAVRAGQVPAALPADPAFAAAGSERPGLYEQSWLACRLIAARAGVSGLARFYRQVGTSDQPAATAIAQALRDVLGDKIASFTAQWRTYLRAQLA